MHHSIRKVALTAGIMLSVSAVGLATTTLTSSLAPVQAATQAAQGPKLADHTYYTITSPNYSFYAGFNWGVKQTSRAVLGQTYLSTGIYHHANGSIYLSLYDANGGWAGYINAKAATKASGEQGAWRKASGYVTLTKATMIYKDFTKVSSGTLPAQETLHITGTYHWFDGTIYYSIENTAHQWLGYVNASGLLTSSNAQGAWQARTGYAQVKHAGYGAWTSFAFTNQKHLSNNQAITINGQYFHANGSVYVSAYDLSGHWLGYINAQAIVGVDKPEGDQQPDNRFVTVTHRYDSYSNFNWTIAQKSAAIYQRTFKSTGIYHHINGNTYLALQNAAGQFVGYINAKSVSVASGSQGTWMAANNYTTFSNANIQAYSDFNLSQVKTAGASLNGHTYHITGMYRRFDGTLLYSLYNNKKQWAGYVNANTIKLGGAQGLWTKASGYFATTQKGVSIWSGFDFGHHVSTNSASYYQHTYQITGVYHHFNESTYYSIQNGAGKWLGYVNAAFGKQTNNAQGVWYKHSGKMVVAKGGYPVWQGFFSHQVNTTSKLKGKTYSVTGQYRHVNGSLYYSLYNGKTWIGYVNAAAMAKPVTYHDWTKPSQSYAYPNLNKYHNINIEVNLAKQQVYIKNGGTVLYTMYCSSGMNNSTPRGHFKIQNRGASFYNASEKMGANYWTSFKDWGVYLFHSVPTNASGNYIVSAAKLLGVRPDSHGCIRLSIPDAKWINSYIKQGASVYIH
jgi:hypothetical protein